MTEEKTVVNKESKLDVRKLLFLQHGEFVRIGFYGTSEKNKDKAKLLISESEEPLIVSRKEVTELGGEDKEVKCELIVSYFLGSDYPCDDGWHTKTEKRKYSTVKQLLGDLLNDNDFPKFDPDLPSPEVIRKADKIIE